MRIIMVEDVRVEWDFVSPMEYCTEKLILKHKNLLANVGLKLESMYMGKTESMTVSNGDERITIKANYNPDDGSWIGVK